MHRADELLQAHTDEPSLLELGLRDVEIRRLRRTLEKLRQPAASALAEAVATTNQLLQQDGVDVVIASTVLEPIPSEPSASAQPRRPHPAGYDTAATVGRAFRVGEAVMRHDATLGWRLGFVTSLDPLLVTCTSTDPRGESCQWQVVRKASAMERWIYPGTWMAWPLGTVRLLDAICARAFAAQPKAKAE